MPPELSLRSVRECGGTAHAYPPQHLRRPMVLPSCWMWGKCPLSKPVSPPMWGGDWHWRVHVTSWGSGAEIILRRPARPGQGVCVTHRQHCVTLTFCLLQAGSASHRL